MPCRLSSRHARPEDRSSSPWAEFEIHLVPVSGNTLRITLNPSAVPDDGALVDRPWPKPIGVLHSGSPAQTFRHGAMRIQFTPDPLSFRISDAAGNEIQTLTIDPATGGLRFHTGTAPLLGLGEGGPQFDRRGSQDRMRSGQGGYQLRTHGGRVPIPWIIGTAGWVLFVHQPAGAFDFTGAEGTFQPAAGSAAMLDVFLLRASRLH